MCITFQNFYTLKKLYNRKVNDSSQILFKVKLTINLRFYSISPTTNFMNPQDDHKFYLANLIYDLIFLYEFFCTQKQYVRQQNFIFITGKVIWTFSLMIITLVKSLYLIICLNYITKLTQSSKSYLPFNKISIFNSHEQTIMETLNYIDICICYFINYQ